MRRANLLREYFRIVMHHFVEWQNGFRERFPSERFASWQLYRNPVQGGTGMACGESKPGI